jgi:hypothetical protein
MTLLDRLAAANLAAYPPGELFVHSVDESGNKTRAPAPLYRSIKLDELRGLVNAKTRDAAPAANPFEPSRKQAEAAQVTGIAAEAKEAGVVRYMQGRSTASEDQLANSYAALRAAGAIK